MKKIHTEYFILQNGLPIVCRRTDSPVEYFGVDINAGSRDESPEQFGLAHFVEHTLFKGTRKRKSCHIINRMEAVGGELNAFTSKEETNIYSIFPHGNLARAVELISDLIRNSQFPEKEINRERQVVKDEIDSYLDTPSEAVYDDFEDLIFAGSQLGHNILGSADTLDHLTTNVCRNYITGNYTASRMVAFYVGAAKPERVRNLVERHFSQIPNSRNLLQRLQPEKTATFSIRREIDLHQSHSVVGARLPGIKSADSHALGLVCNILGGPGMNSRLNVALRERRGLVYTVEASNSLLTDCGLFTTYFGCDPEDRDRCIELVTKELHRISTEPLTSRALAAAKKQYLGQLIIASDNMEQMALTSARSMLLLGSVATAEETRNKINSLTPDDILKAASYIAPQCCSILSLG